ncbi:MAG: sigma-54-dependent Fis family transcriptional regulator [Candidatus Eisenbacteria bacterium]|uniref:Sigma-54-dependent Fis family transcriptional regulator n=1 Tax=Eiseniibacteriota bacterium TaxID=2212470 RepID=A0A7Y2H3M2_UNCEI|nr:sigma-54-dependent Fis family transcriptional regulator [Candidatus Eisenbacteria bacterium]
MTNAHILIVDDQESIRHFIEKAMIDQGYQVSTAGEGGKALELIESEEPDLVLLDLRLPDTHGLEILRRVKEDTPDLQVIIMTAFGDVESAVRAMKLGAHDYINKPINLDQLFITISKALESRKLWRELKHLRQKHTDRLSKDFVKGNSPLMQNVYETIEQVAQSDTTSVLIQGESGTGKEHVANLIHELSSRADKPFLEINCAAIPKELLESELFGHEKGAFTDARNQKQGLLEMANGGTLFLDEVGEMSLQVQVKLLRVLERMTFKRVGGTKDINVSVRIISATNQDLQRLCEEKMFREDLYYRLKVVPLRVPALRERPGDIMPLAKHFLYQFSKQFTKPFQGFSNEAEQVLMTYPWPGNIRELKNLMERTVLLESSDRIEAEMLKLGSGRTTREVDSPVAMLEKLLEEPGVPSEGIPFEPLMAEIEQSLILKASEASSWNQSRTAEILNLKRDKLRYRMKLYSITKPKRRRAA